MSSKEEKDRKIVDITFNSTGEYVPNLPKVGWGWKIPQHPERQSKLVLPPPELEELEEEEDQEEETQWDAERANRVLDTGVYGHFTGAEREVWNLGGKPQTREVWRTKTYVYWAPFNYENVTVELGRPGTGCEFNADGVELDVYPYGSITIIEEEPIVAVTVIGSGCSYVNYVLLEAEPLEWKFSRTGVRMRRDDLRGVHVRGDAWMAGVTENWNDAGLSSARFDLPESRRVIIGGGSTGGDPHYAFRIIRIEVKEAASMDASARQIAGDATRDERR
jgi:hypothetical protein